MSVYPDGSKIKTDFRTGSGKMSESVLILDGSPHNFFHMKTYTSILAFLFMLLISCGNPSEKESETDHAVLSPSARLLWKSDTTFTGSESALYYEPEDIIFVSCGNTQPLEKDGDGFIAIEIGRASCRERVEVLDGALA